jgi:hypothetical protein
LDQTEVFVDRENFAVEALKLTGRRGTKAAETDH